MQKTKVLRASTMKHGHTQTLLSWAFPGKFAVHSNTAEQEGKISREKNKRRGDDAVMRELEIEWSNIIMS